MAEERSGGIMTTLITRLYRTLDEAKAARKALKADGCPNKAISLLFKAPETEAHPAPHDLAAIERAGVYPSAAKTYAPHVEAGAALLVVRAPFGAAVRTHEILDGFPDLDVGVSPVDAYIESQPTPRRSKDGSATLLDSDLLFLSDNLAPPALLKDGWTFSHYLGIPLLTDWMPTGGGLFQGKSTISSYLGLPLLTKSQAPRAGLLKNGTPFSSLFGLPLLSKDPDQRDSSSR
jgi:hypothetical protein